MRLRLYCPNVGLAPLVFAEIIEWYAYAFKEQGHEIVVENPERWVLFGCNMAPRITFPKDTIIIDLEQMGDEGQFHSPIYMEYLRSYTVWTYTLHNQRWLTSKGIHATHVPLCYSPLMKELTPSTEDIDVLFVGNPTPQRSQTIQVIRDAGLPVLWTEAWGEAKDLLMSRAKIVLNLRGFDTVRLFCATRILPALAQKRFVITEDATNLDEYSYLLGGVIVAPRSALPSVIRFYLQHPEARVRIAAEGYRAVKSKRLSLP